MWDVESWTVARNGKGMENDTDTLGKESEETRPPEEVLEDQSNAVVTTVIKDKVVLLIQLSTAKPITRHPDKYWLKICHV